MSQNRPPPHCNGNAFHYVSKSTDDFHDIHDAPNVTNLLALINSVVDGRDTHSIIANASLSHIPHTFRRRPRSNSAIVSSQSVQKLKARTRPLRPPLLHLPCSNSNSTNSDRNDSNPLANSIYGADHDHTSPRSYSSVMDYKDLHEEQKYPNHSSTPSPSNDGSSIPKMPNRLSAILSVGVLELDNNAPIDREYNLNHDIHEHEPDTNHITDPRTKQECKRIMFLYNSKSGGQKAVTLLRYFRAYSSLIYDLLQLNSSPTELRKLAHDLTVYQHKIVVCIVGGDGSQCWGTSLIDKALQTVSPAQSIRYPTIVPFPVGTGNDLSRSLGWGNTERTPDKIIKHIADVEYCFNLSKRFSVLDRWSIHYAFDEGNKENESTTFSPPLPTQFMCYLSFGYDAMITHNFAKQRKMYPQRFSSQLANQAVYFKMGLKELVKPSNPVNDSILLEIDGKVVHLPKDTRSLKLVNINSAANGVFFWGYLKSNKEELQTWKRPQLNDGLIEVMATRGSPDLVSAKMRMGHAHRLGQSNDVKLKVIKTPVYLQIDGEGWCIEDPCTLHIQLHDQLPTLIGYKFPRGVYHKYEADYYTDEEKEARHRYRDVIRMKYNIPKSVSRTNDGDLPQLKKSTSMDDFNLNLQPHEEEEDSKRMEEEDCSSGGSGEIEHEDAEKYAKYASVERNERNQGYYRSMSDMHSVRARQNKKLTKQKSWKPLFANKNSWKRNQTDKGEREKKKKKKSRKVMKWF